MRFNKIFNMKRVVLVVYAWCLAIVGSAQITAPSSSFTGRTSYTTFGSNHDVHVFCASSADNHVGALQANAPMGQPATFVWEKYDQNVAIFDSYATTNSSLNSQIQNLDDGCYRVTISDGSTTSGPYYAWVLNDWIEASAEIPDSSSNCFQFRIFANFTHAPLDYYDLASNDPLSFRKGAVDFSVAWTTGGEFVSPILNATVETPPAKDTKYDLTITDKTFNCTGTTSVNYISKTTLASFSYNPQEGEAVLPVQFTNTSLNSDSTYWYFYKDLAIIKSEVEKAKEGTTVDSIDFVLTIPSPSYEYEWTGKFRVKLKTVKVNASGNCYDISYMPVGTYINVDTAWVEAPNAFSPNGDAVNEMFVIKTGSLKNIHVQIMNRWGGVVHNYKNGNIRSNETTYKFAVWDGRIGNRMASPGVYYYMITAEGRDGRKLKRHGFFHLLR